MIRQFERQGHVNWVDTNDVFVGFATEEKCCERTGWFCCDTEEAVFEELASLQVIDAGYDAPPAPARERLSEEGAVFDPDYCVVIRRLDGTSNQTRDKCNAVILRVLNGDTRYFCIYNLHNGYYMHGFKMGRGPDDRDPDVELEL
ncbi:MAG: hypothetical protein WC683_05775 [bacterium]